MKYSFKILWVIWNKSHNAPNLAVEAQKQKFPTNFRDLKLLKEVLDLISISFQEQNNQISFRLEIGELIFSQLGVNEAIIIDS